MKRKESRKDIEERSFVYTLKKDIDRMEKELSDVKKANIKRAIIRNVKITGRLFLKYVPTYLTGFIIGFPFFEYVGMPFIPRPIKSNAYIETKQDTLGHIEQKKQYINYNSTIPYVDMCSNWEKDGDLYTRKISRYNLDSEKLAKCYDVATGNLITNFESVFGEPTSIFYETNNSLTEEELNASSYARITTYGEDKNDITLRMPTTPELISISCLYILTVAVVDIVSFAVTRKNRFRCDAKIKGYKEEYRVIDQSYLEKELQLKKDNYKMIVGE